MLLKGIWTLPGDSNTVTTAVVIGDGDGIGCWCVTNDAKASLVSVFTLASIKGADTGAELGVVSAVALDVAGTLAFLYMKEYNVDILIRSITLATSLQARSFSGNYRVY